MSKQKISSEFKITKELGALYTGGPVGWGEGLAFTTCNGGINIIKDGSVVERIEEEEDPVINFAVITHNNAVVLASAHKSSLIRQREIKMAPADEIKLAGTDTTNERETVKIELIRTFRSIHVGPISCMKLAILPQGGKLLATGGTDGTVKIWDLDHQYYTHNFRTGNGVCTVIQFHPTKLVLFGGFMSGALYSWDLQASTQLHAFEGHFSAVTALQILTNRGGVDHLGVTCGRDKVIITWDLDSGKRLRTVPVGDSCEGLCVLKSEDKFQVAIATGTQIRVWDLHKKDQAKKVNELEVNSEILQLMTDYAEEKDNCQNVWCATSDHNLVNIKLGEDDLSVANTVVGNNDEILALANCGINSDSTCLVVACNSSLLRLYQRSDWSCELVKGHSDSVLCLAASQTDTGLVASGGKDKQIRIWRLVAGDNKKNGGRFVLSEAVQSKEGHTEAVTGLAFSKVAADRLLSVSKDTTVKVWQVDYDSGSMASVRTEIGHEKEINCCDISPGDELYATGSQDKTVKLWTPDLQLVATLRGHKRGVWCCQFSPADRLIATGSADGLIKIWSLTEFSCLKQLEGHDCSVLQLAWFSDCQLASSASDGLVKVWWMARQECVGTMDQNEDKVWALTACRGAGGEGTNAVQLTAGSSGGRLITWTDVTETANLEKQAIQDHLIQDQQKLSNLLQAKEFGKALKLALRLSQPFTALKIIKKLDQPTLKAAVGQLDMSYVDQLMGYTVKWNSNSRHAAAAQGVLHAVLSLYSPETLLKLSSSRDWVEGLLPYTEKHFARLSRLQMKSKFLDYMALTMKATNISLKNDSAEIAMES